MLEKIRPAIEGTEAAPDEDRTSANMDYIDRVAESNVRLTCEGITRESEVLRDLQAAGSLEICGAIYDVRSGGVKFLGN
jgi:carbonic anhydrase